METNRYFRINCPVEEWGQTINAIIDEGYLITGYNYVDLDTVSGLFFKVDYSDTKPAKEGWIEMSAKEMYDLIGDAYGVVTYEEAYPTDPEPYPEPDPVDPTITQLTQIIVETSVNVDYLVSMQSFQ